MTDDAASENELIERIHRARNPQPPVEPSGDEGEEEQPTEEGQEEPGADDEEVTADPLEEDDGTPTEDTGDAEEEMFLELPDGSEVSLSEVLEWKSGNLRQSDYTRKTQDLAEQRKALETERSKIKDLESELNDLRPQLEALLEDQPNWEELKREDPELYIEAKELQEKRAAAVERLKKATAKPAMSSEDIAREQQLLLEANPGWVKDGKTTEAYDKDIGALNRFFEKNGFTSDEVNGFLTAKVMGAFIKAAKYDAAQSSLGGKAKQKAKATLTPRPSKSSANTGLHKQIKAAEAKFKQTGRIEDAMVMRRLKAKLKS